MDAVALLDGWLPPTKENWQLILWVWQLFPIFTAIQWITDFYPQGKTSIQSSLNLPGKWAWALMESPGFLIVGYIMLTLPAKLGIEQLPYSNWALAGMFTIHYIYRALVSPLFLNPSMSPIHPLVFFSALTWQVLNGLAIGGWLAGYGPTSTELWINRPMVFMVGFMLWGNGLLFNIYHDDVLREIRRKAQRKQQASASKGSGQNVGKVYEVPEDGLFEWILYPHFLCEWIEWTGFWIIAGLGCVPARCFVINEIATMLPRALSGKRWYIEKFGKEKIGSRTAVIPGLL